MSNELQPDSKLIFKAGEVFLESHGKQMPIEEVIDINLPRGAALVNTLRTAAADRAELNGR